MALSVGVSSLLLLGACSGDDTAETTTPTAGEDGRAGVLRQLPGRRSGDDPAGEGPAAAKKASAALDALEATVPAQLADDATVVIDFGRAILADPENSGPPTPEFNAAYSALVAFTASECEFQRMDVTVEEYSFAGIAHELDAGRKAISVTNSGKEFHEMLLLRINDGVAESLDELLALPQDEAATKTTMVGQAFAPIGDTAGAVVDLKPGRYAALCFLPVGSTQEAWDSMMSAGADPEGTPHAMQGMAQEFTVK
ncbi:MAG: hypothetical protein R2698_12325 [Microthrixaceae bacterium]